MVLLLRENVRGPAHALREELGELRGKQNGVVVIDPFTVSSRGFLRGFLGD